MDSLFLREGLICSFLFIGGMSDLYRFKVRNRSVAISFLLLIIIRLLCGDELLWPFFCGLAVTAALFPLYKLSLLGAADIKVFALILFAFPGDFGLEIIFLGFSLALVFELLRLLSLIIRKGSISLSLGIRRDIKTEETGAFGLRRRLALTPFMLFGALLRFIF